MQHVGGGAAQRESPIHLIFLGLLFTPPKGRDRGAHRNVHQKATGIEGPYRDESGGNRGLHDHPHRPAGESAAALRALPAAMPEGAQRASAAGMARSIDAEIAVEAALPPTSSRMSEVRRAGGGLSLSGAVGAGHHGSVQCRGETGTGIELARDGTPVRPELEKRGHDCEAGGAVRVEKPVATARTRDRDRYGEPAQGPSLSHGGLRFGAAGSTVGGRRPDRGGGQVVLHQRNGAAALPYAPGHLYGYVGGIRQPGERTRTPGPDSVRPVPHRQAPQ